PEEIAQAKAQEATAQAALARAEQDYDRAQQLIKQKAISSQEFDANKAAFLEAQAAVKSAQATVELSVIGPRAEDIAAGRSQVDAAAAQVRIADRRLEDAVLVSPHDGVILTRAREAGAIVNPGETVATLTLTSPVWVRSYVGETDLGNVQPGMLVDVLTDTVSGRSYHGRVGFISPTAEFTPKSVETRELRTSLVYRLRIVVDDPDGGLRQGMPVTVKVEVSGTQPRSFTDRLWEALGLASLN
ncbi:MAG: efflux RND transporter periplasmic adaptor subunit, partial [Aureliella sp.]